MKVGILLIFQNYLGRGRDEDVVAGEKRLAELAEEVGFDRVWAVEHHFTDYTMTPDPVQFLAAVGGHSKKVKLGTMVVVLPWNDPMRVAEKISMLDCMSDGRVIFELYNEPHTISPQQWRDGSNPGGAEAQNATIVGMQDMYNAVRAQGANNLVLIGGLDFAYNLTQVLPAFEIDGINIAYVTHPYRFKNPAPPAGYQAAAANYPLIATEFGDADVGGIGPNDCGTAPYSSAIADTIIR